MAKSIGGKPTSWAATIKMKTWVVPIKTAGGDQTSSIIGQQAQSYNKRQMKNVVKVKLLFIRAYLKALTFMIESFMTLNQCLT